MMDQAGVFKASVCAVTLSVLTTVCAQDAQPAAAAQPAAVSAAEQPPPAKLFGPLVRVMNIHGVCEVKNPDVGSYQPAANNKAYPLGSSFRTGAGGDAVLIFSAQESAQILESSEVVVASPEKNPDGRALRIVSGKVKTTLRDNLPEGSFSVQTPNSNCKNVAGRGEFSLSCDTTTETLQIKIITGSARIEGGQYQIPALRAANTVEIQTANDRSLSRLTGISGDFAVILENGSETPVTFGMSPKAIVKVWREVAPVGGRAIISVLVVGPTGLARHRFAYAEGRPNLSTGELIAPVENEEKDKEEMPVLLTTGAKKEEAPAGAAEKAAEPQAEAKVEKDAAK
jgi:hypothetical protein